MVHQFLNPRIGVCWWVINKIIKKSILKCSGCLKSHCLVFFNVNYIKQSTRKYGIKLLCSMPCLLVSLN